MIPHSKPTLGQEEEQAIARVMQSGMLAQGREVAAFEEACAAYVGRAHGIAVNSGTAALHLSLLALGCQGKRVAFSSYTCAALLQAITMAGAEPVLCDCDENGNLDFSTVPEDVDAIIPAHLFGLPGPIPNTATPIIEDIAQSIGAPCGQTGTLAITSFYATKLLTTGEGGMIFCDDAALADTLRDLRDYDNRHTFTPRFAYKMTEFQAAMGQEQLKKLPGFIEKRRAIATAYNDAFRDLPLLLPPANDQHIYFRYVVGTNTWKAMAGYLESDGIGARRPVHHPAHHDLGGTFPQAEKRHLENLSLPIYPTMDEEQVAIVIESTLRFFGL